MALQEVSIEDLSLNPFTTIFKDWLLVSAGGPDKVNMMTASWGAMGVLWAKNTITCYVRETRYTKQLLDECPGFGISVLPEKYRKALQICGTKSGRDIDKVAETGLTPTYIDGVPVFEEAKLAFVCKKVLRQTLSADSFVDPTAHASWYEKGENMRNYHTMYIGTIEHTLQASE